MRSSSSSSSNSASYTSGIRTISQKYPAQLRPICRNLAKCETSVFISFALVKDSEIGPPLWKQPAMRGYIDSEMLLA